MSHLDTRRSPRLHHNPRPPNGSLTNVLIMGPGSGRERRLRAPPAGRKDRNLPADFARGRSQQVRSCCKHAQAQHSMEGSAEGRGHGAAVQEGRTGAQGQTSARKAWPGLPQPDSRPVGGGGQGGRAGRHSQAARQKPGSQV